MRITTRSMLGIAALAVCAQAAAQVTFYEREGFRGRTFTADRAIGNFERFGFNDRASSVIVERGRWELCEDARWSGRCVLLRPGQYASLDALGLGNRISSVRPAPRTQRHAYEAPPPVAAPAYEYYPRHGEPLFTANVTSARAVVTTPNQQHCWVEREQAVRADPNGPNVPGAIAGAVIGGILGHQVGGGRGQDVATALGAVGGAAVGSNVGGGSQVVTRDVQRCANVQGPARAEYWDVTYVFQGREHRAQLSAPPGATITVNRNGEPRM